jgi:hypothetical protein
MAKLAVNLPDGLYLITQDLLTSEHFDRNQINLMVALGTVFQFGIALIAVVGTTVQVIDGALPETFVRLVLGSDPEPGFTCMVPTKRLVARYSYVPVR